MEPFTHAFTSLALARAAGRRLPRFGTTMMVVSGLAADLDYVSYFGGASAFMRFHRSVLHSVAGSAVMACAVAGAFCALDNKMPPKKKSPSQTFTSLAFIPAFTVCVFGAAGHMLLDVASGVGVQLLWPFRAHWTAWNLMNDLDLWALLLLIVGLLLPLLFGLVNEEVGARKRGPGEASRLSSRWSCSRPISARAPICTAARLICSFHANITAESRWRPPHFPSHRHPSDGVASPSPTTPPKR